MPNWCDNTLTITGPKKEIDTFLEKAKNLSEDRYISLERLLPVPEELKMNREEPVDGLPTMSDEEYDWRVKNWGTKWDLSRMDEPKWLLDGWKIVFRSAWSPPYKALIKIAKIFPQLTFDLEYFEFGMGFEGKLKVNGENVEEEWEKDLE